MMQKGTLYFVLGRGTGFCFYCLPCSHAAHFQVLILALNASCKLFHRET